MSIGTKSVLFGAHCFFLHPLFLAFAWWRLYGWDMVDDPYLGKVSLKDYRLWIAFFVHDLGYFGKPNMDGKEGEMHPLFGAELMGWLFGADWFLFCYYHSRFLAKQSRMSFSILCVADKFAITLEPFWLYIPRATFSGEIFEYMKHAENGANGKGKYADQHHTAKSGYVSKRDWFERMTCYLNKWVEEHKDGKTDTWTPGVK